MKKQKHLLQSLILFTTSYIVLGVGYLAPDLFEPLKAVLFLPTDGNSLIITLISVVLSMGSGVCAFLCLVDYHNSKQGFIKYIVIFLITELIAAVLFCSYITVRLLSQQKQTLT